jgi:hypothetical protein
VNTTPYPAEVRIMPRRKRPWRAWIFLLAVAALVLAALAWSPKVQPRPAGQRPTTAVTRQQSVHPAPAKAGVTVTVGKVTYACSVPLKPKR